MANEEQVKILKQGVDIWNEWYRKNLMIQIDLSKADFHGADLSKAELYRANLSGANLIGVNLRGNRLYGADLSEANLRETFIREANLSGANLHKANLTRANLTGANLTGANLTGADLTGADLNGANLSKASLGEAYLNIANLSGADLTGASFHNCRTAGTIFSRVDLRKTDGLQDIKHAAPSTIGTDTLQTSQGLIPEKFLRGCGLSDWEIESSKLYKPALSNEQINNIIYKIFDLRAQQSIQISPLFISYSHADTPYVEKLETCLMKLGVRFWRDVHNATAGRLEKQIDHAMRQNPTVILILSKNSTRSDWVEHEARLARELEKEIGRDVLCPIALDDSWKSAKWPKRLMEQIMEYNILDYSNWNDDKAFEQVFNKMISGLDMFYKSDEESSK